MAGRIEHLHATAISTGGRAALIRGPSGSGKSDLALRCIAQAITPFNASPAMLVADDQVIVENDGDAIFASAPANIAGKLEVRGLGILELQAAPRAKVVLVVDLVRSGEPERMPDPWPYVTIRGRSLPVLRLAPFEASAPLKLLAALAAGAIQPHG